MRKFNSNWIGLFILVTAWSYAAFRFADISRDIAAEKDPNHGKKVIRVLHWQLEPGYRDGMSAVIEDYNNLPHVKANRVEVRQMAVTERVYAQFLNVHLISGTAPDIVAKGMSQLLGSGTALTRFFEPISGYVNEPNPYNQPEYLPEGIRPELKKFLQNAPWNETFTDGMLGGWDDVAQDYFAVPVSSWGAMRTFVNLDLSRKIKAYLREAWAKDPQPTWLTWIVEEENILTPDEAFLNWLEGPDVPDTLGRFMVFNEAVLAYAEAKNLENLVPISASSYFTGTMINNYAVPLTANVGRKLDLNHDSNVSGRELLATWQAGMWDFDNPHLKDAYFNVVTWLERYYPAGFLGLDREQAVRRFLSEQAVFITTGGWDASTLFQGAEGEFEVGVISAPIPGPGERWFQYSAGYPNEAEHKLGVPLAVNKESPNIDWAIDFLRYISSYSANQKLNRMAGWVPSVVGARPVEQMLPFLPRTEGLKGSIQMGFGALPTVRTVYDGLFPLYQTGDLSYEDFVTRLEEGFQQPRTGINRMWYEEFIAARDRTRQNERSRVINRIQGDQRGWSEKLRAKQANLLELSLNSLDGFEVKAEFHQLFPDRDYPTLDQ